MKYLLPLLMFLFPAMCYSYNSGVCYPSSGGPFVQSFATGETSIGKEQNTANSVLISNKELNTGQSVVYSCYCVTGNSQQPHYWYARGMFFPITNEGTYAWQPLTANLSASVELYVYNSTGGSRVPTYHSVPFDAVSNGVTESCTKDHAIAATGSQGTVSIKITKPAIGHIAFSGTVAKMWHYRRNTGLDPADPVEVLVNLNVSIDVPDNCTLQPGGIMNIDLGSTPQTQFSGQVYSQPPKSYTPRPVNLIFDCTVANNSLDVTLVGTKDEQGQGYTTSNPDISVIVTNESGSIISPNELAGIVNLNSDMSTDVLKLKAYPTNSSSNTAPQAGSFETTATILLNYD